MLIILQLLHLFSFRAPLLGEATLAHDNIIWNYPTFQYYFSELSAGHLPIYNFFSHFGEPFLPNAIQMRFWDPLQTLIGLSFWKIFPEPVMAFNWFHYVIGVLQCFGMYLFLRSYTHSLWIRALLMIGLMFSSAFIGPLRQDGFINQFLWVPYMAYILREKFILSHPSWRSCLLLGCLIGSTFQSYFFVAPAMFLGAYLGFTWLSRGRIAIFEISPKNLAKLSIVLIPPLFMAALNVQTILASRDWHFPARSMPTAPEYFYKFDRARLQQAGEAATNNGSLRLSTKEIQLTGASSRFWDYIQSFSPWGNYMISSEPKLAYGDPSEAYIYLGLLILFMGFWGLAIIDTPEDIAFLNLLSLFFLLSLGQDAGLTTRLAYVFPPIAFVRNTHCLTLFVHFLFFYFVIKGLKRLDDRLARLANIRF